MSGYTKFMIFRDALDHNMKHIISFGAPKTEAYRLITEIKKIIDENKTPPNELYRHNDNSVCGLCYKSGCSCFKIY